MWNCTLTQRDTMNREDGGKSCPKHAQRGIKTGTQKPEF